VEEQTTKNGVSERGYHLFCFNIYRNLIKINIVKNLQALDAKMEHLQAEFSKKLDEQQQKQMMAMAQFQVPYLGNQ
jgi:hypothetical protein